MQSELIVKALEALKAGQTILYPTDTIWGIGCDATMEDAVEKIYAIKERDHQKSMLALITEEMLDSSTPTEVRKLITESDRPTTVIIPTQLLAVKVAANLPAQDGTIGVRIPRFDFCQMVLRQLGHPIVSTSANLSGHPSPAAFEDIEPEIHQRVELDLPDDDAFHHEQQSSSRIVKFSPTGEIIIIRG